MLRPRPKTPGGANATFSPGRNVSYPLLLDEMLSGAIAGQLRAKGHDALAVVDDPAAGQAHAGLVLISAKTFAQDRSFTAAITGALIALLDGPGHRQAGHVLFLSRH
jgi:hypothetical protein